MPSLSKAKTSTAHLREVWPGQINNGTHAARLALAFAADPEDLYAAIGWLTLGPVGLPLQDAMRLAADGVLPTHQALRPLATLGAAVADWLVADLLAQVIAATRLRGWAMGLTEPQQALADLARLEAEALAFDRMAAELKVAAGFHGAGAQIFLGWIAAQTEKDWNRHPDPDGWSASGVEISTWHGAKGREWPITLVSGLDFKFPERPGSLRAEFDSFDDLGHVLDHAGLGWLPDFAAPEKQLVFADQLITSDEDGASRELYVALTRARDRLVLVLPAAPSKAKDRPDRMVDLLRDRTGFAVGPGGITLCGETFPARILHEPRDRDFALPPSPSDRPFLRFGRPEARAAQPRTPWRRTPSSLLPEEGLPLPPLSHVRLGPRVGGRSDAFPAATERGSAWHLAFRSLLERPDLRERLAVSTGLDDRTLDEIEVQAQTLRNWLRAEGYDRLHFELPLQRHFADGSEVNAIIDCLAEGAEGVLILDHKSGPCPDPAARFASYLPQLTSYAELVALQFPDKPMRGVAINWMNEGTLTVAPLLATARESA